VTSLARQRDQARALVAGHGRIVAEFSDIGQSRALAWARRPQAAALIAALADPERGWDAIVIGEYERAFYGGQYASMAPLFEHYGVQLWTPEVGGRIDHHAEDHILANPRYTGRQVWNRQRTDSDLIDPANTGLGHQPVQRWNLPSGWVISARPAHPAIISEADYIAAQDASAPRGPAGLATRRYLLAGLLRCGLCGRRLESAWSNGKPAYRCRHGYTSATRPDPGRPKNLYIREDQILPRLATLAILHASDQHAQRGRNEGSAQITAPAQAADLIDHLHATGIILLYDPSTRTLRTDQQDAVAVAIGQARS